ATPAGEAEVGERRFAVGGEQDVRRLDVPMEDASPVCRRQRVGTPGGERHDLGGGETAVTTEAIGEGAAERVLHGDGDAVAVGHQLVDADDVGMVEGGE